MPGGTRATPPRRPLRRPPATVLGAVLAGAGAFSFGVTIVIGRSLANADLDAPTVLGIRFTSAALLLLGLQAGARRPLRPASGERVVSLALGALYGLESTAFFMGLERGTAAAVTLLFYSYPGLVLLLDLARGGARPTPRVLAALAASAAGAALVVAAGDRVSISGAGVAFAFVAAGVFAVYLVASDRLLGRSDTLTTAAWVTLGCGLTHLTRGAVTWGLQDPGGHLPALAGNGLATASAFSLMFAGLRLLGPSSTAVVMTLEAFFAIVLGAVFLSEPLGALQVLGGAAILGGAVAVATSPATPELDEASGEPP